MGADVLLRILLKPTTWLILLVAVLGTTVAIQRKVHQHDLTVIAQRTAEREAALSAGKACSDGTERLRQAAEDRDKAVAAAARLAHARALADERRATATLQEKPTVITPSGAPDLCASAMELIRRKVQERKEPR